MYESWTAEGATVKHDFLDRLSPSRGWDGGLGFGLGTRVSLEQHAIVVLTWGRLMAFSRIP